MIQMSLVPFSLRQTMLLLGWHIIISFALANVRPRQLVVSECWLPKTSSEIDAWNWSEHDEWPPPQMTRILRHLPRLLQPLLQLMPLFFGILQHPLRLLQPLF